MRHMDVDDGWVRRAGALTVQLESTDDTDHLVKGQVLVARLTTVARSLSCSGGHERCAFAPHPAAPLLCALARDLALRAPLGALPAHSGADVAARFVSALAAAAAAVYFCRRIEHTRDGCWFSSHGPGDDLCGRVLHVSHHLSR